MASPLVTDAREQVILRCEMPLEPSLVYGLRRRELHAQRIIIILEERVETVSPDIGPPSASMPLAAMVMHEESAIAVWRDKAEPTADVLLVRRRESPTEKDHPDAGGDAAIRELGRERVLHSAAL